jgi:hypothetical protein
MASRAKAPIPRYGARAEWRTSASVLAADGSRRDACCCRDPVTNRQRSKTLRRGSDAELVEADLLGGVSVPAPADGSRRVRARWPSGG